MTRSSECPCTINSGKRPSFAFILTLWAFSRGSAPLMSIPLAAPTPVPTMTAVGVASPSAHGQAIASTVSAIRNPNCHVTSASLQRKNGEDLQVDLQRILDKTVGYNNYILQGELRLDK